MRRILLGTCLLAAATTAYTFGQQQPGQMAAPPMTGSAETNSGDATFRSKILRVAAPTIVLDKNGSFVDDLTPNNFRLFDNGQLQKDVVVDTTATPISMVVAIQANGGMSAVLPKLRHIGSLLEGEVLGERGEAAILAFDHRQQVIQDFTHDGEKFNRALERINPGSSTHAMIDAVNASVRMLSKRPRENRKIILLIGEVNDNGSQARAREVLTDAEFGNVTVYVVSVSRLTTQATGEHVPQATSPIPPAASVGTMPGSAPVTPLSMEQIKGINSNGSTTMDLKPVIQDIMGLGKKVFVNPPAEVLATYTGGKKYEFYKEKGLENAFRSIAGELHREYLLTYTPSTTTEGGYHEIVVQVDRRNLSVRTRPGYWYAGQPER